MEKKKNIVQKNDKGEYHGYQEWYMYNAVDVDVRTTMKNGKEIGYEEWHNKRTTNFFIR